MPDESEVGCESCVHADVCVIHKQMQGFIKNNWVHFGNDPLPVQQKWYGFLASQCQHYTGKEEGDEKNVESVV